MKSSLTIDSSSRTHFKAFKFSNLTMEQRRKWFGFFIALPALIAVFSTIFYPLFLGILNSFRDVNLMRLDSISWNGFDNYIKLYNDRYFWNALKNTAIFTTTWTFGAAMIGLLAAVLLNRETRMNRIIVGMLLIPWIIPPVAVAFVFRTMAASRNGIFNEILLEMGLIKRSLKFFESPDMVGPSVIVTTMWIAFPFFMLMFLAGLKTIPKDLTEAAMIDGANAFQRFLYITLPLLKGVIVIATTLSIVWGFNFFDLIYTISKGGPLGRSETFVILAQRMAFSQADIGYTSALGVVWLVMLIVASYTYLKQLKVI